MFSCLPRAGAASLWKNDGAAIKRGEQSESEDEIILRTGEKKRLLAERHPIEGPGGEKLLAVTLADSSHDKLAAAKAQKNAETLKLYFDMELIGIIITDPAGIIVEVNEQTCKILNYDQEKLVGSDIFSLFHKQETEKADFLRRKTRRFAKDMSLSLETRFIDGAGQKTDVSLSVNIRRAGDGSPENLIFFMRDISAQKAAERFLCLQKELSFGLASARSMEQAAEKLLALGMKAEGIRGGAFFLTDSSGRDLSRTAQKGVRCPESVRLPEFLSQAVSGKPLHIEYEEMIAKGQTDTFIKNLSGPLSFLPVSFNGETLGVLLFAGRGPKPIPVFSKMILETISSDAGGVIARIRAVESVRKNEERFRLMVEHLPAGVVYIEKDKVFVNGAVETLTGRPRSEFADVPSCCEKLFGAMAGSAQKLIEADRANRFPAARNMTVRAIDGAERTINFSAFSFERGEIWLLNDVTERAEMEARLRASEERLNLILKATSDGAWDLDLSAGVIRMEKRLMDILNYPLKMAKLDFQKFQKLIHPNDVSRFAKDLNKHLKGESKTFDCSFRLRDGCREIPLDARPRHRHKQLQKSPR